MTFDRLKSLDDHWVVITGANGAIARATAKKLSDAGATIVGIAHRDTEDIQKFYKDIGGILRIADVTDSRAIAVIAQELQRCDILINNAGWTTQVEHHKLEAMTDELIDKLLSVNLKSHFTTTREFLPLLKRSDNALVVNISSGSAEGMGYGSNIMYAASKSAINGLTKDLARALAPKIRVIAISPPLVSDSNFAGYSVDVKIKSAMKIPLRRGSTCDDVANAIEAYSTMVRFTTGVIVSIDGGRSLL